MGKNKYFSNDLRNRVVEFKNQGLKQCAIAKNLRITEGAVSKILKKFRLTGSVTSALKTGRPRKTNANIDKRIKKLSESDPRMSSDKIKVKICRDYDVIITDRTVRRRLCEAGLMGRVAVKKPLLSKKNRKARIKFAQQHLHWTTQKWNTVLWSDESKFNVFGSDGRSYVRRPVGKRYHFKYQKPTVKHGGGNVMVWGCFSRSGTGPIIKIEGKMDRFVYRDILANTMLPFAEEEMPLTWRFQQDNDPKHSSRLIKNWFLDQNVDVLEWPSQSPDLNPIEHLWEHLDRQIRLRSIHNKNELWEVLQDEWSKIPAEVCQKLVDSMTKRCQAVIKAKGYATKY
jgi:transposase